MTSPSLGHTLRSLLLLLAFILAVAGCSHKYGTLATVVSASWDDASASFPRLDPLQVDIFVERTLYDDLPSPSWLMTNMSDHRLRRKLLGAIDDFPSFANASSTVAAGEATYHLTIEATDSVTQGTSATRHVLFPILLVPHTVSNTVYLRAHLFHLDELLGTYEASGSYETTYHVLFLLTPWLWQPAVRDNVIDDTVRQLFMQIQNDIPKLIPASQS